MDNRKPNRSSLATSGHLANAISSARSRTMIFCVFIVLVFVTGGSSRSDSGSLLILRPLSMMAVAYFFWVRWTDGSRKVSLPLLMLLLFIALHIVQLVPLPPAIWIDFPGREHIGANDKLLAMSGTWRPLTLAPAATVNSLFSLAVPLAALLAFEGVPTASHPLLLRTLLMTAAASILLGLAQSVGTGTLFSVNKISTQDAAVGLFANQNHHSLFLGIAIIIAAVTARRALIIEHRSLFDLFLAGGVVSAAVGLILIIGSRGGVLTGGLALAFVFFSVITGRRERLPGGCDGSTTAVRGSPTILAHIGVRWPRQTVTALLAFAGLLIAGLLVAASRTTALDRFFNPTRADGLRADILPTLWEMHSVYFPVGVGFGAFEAAYRAFEPERLLGPSYLNNAHNDWLQLGIEGGIAAEGLLLLLFIRLATRAFSKASPKLGWDEFGAFAIVGCFALSSLAEYPLRTPSLMLVAALFVGWLLSPHSSKANDEWI